MASLHILASSRRGPVAHQNANPRLLPVCPSSVVLAIGGVFRRVLAKHSKSFSVYRLHFGGGGPHATELREFLEARFSQSFQTRRGIDRLHEQRLCNDTELRASDVAANRGIDTIAVAIGIVAGRKIYDGRLAMRSA